MLAAVAVASWRTLLWQPPTNRIAAYEQAPAFHGMTATIGPNQIRIESLARTQRNRSVSITGGVNLTDTPLTVPHIKTLVACSSWLDVAQIELSPGRESVEIIELRVFDHVKRERLELVDPRYGCRVVQPNVIQLYGLGHLLPEKVDLWLRVHSYEVDSPMATLSPIAGETVKVSECTFAIEAVQAGFEGWSSDTGFEPVEEGDHYIDTALVLTLEGGAPESRFQIAAVTKDGTKRFFDRYLDVRHAARSLITFPLPLDEIKHFEVRPEGGRHRFFFDGLQLPVVVNPKQSFDRPPAAVVEAYGKPFRGSVQEFAPLDVRFQLLDGLPYQGARGGAGYADLLPDPGEIEGLGSSISLTVDSSGLGSPNWSFQFKTDASAEWQPQSRMLNQGGASASSGSNHVMMRGYDQTLSEVEAIEITLDPPAP